jgi:menaquinone-dependent protoporphyrinogen oxidase
MRVLICYATTDGQTRKIAEFIADAARKKGHEVDLVDANMAEDVDPSRFQAVVLAGSVHIGRYQTALVHRIKRWRETLNARPTAFVSVSLSAASDDPHMRAEMDECARHMLQGAGLEPAATLHVAGALRFTQYDFFRRWIMRLIANQQMETPVDPTRDMELTDWDAVAQFIDDFLSRIRA